MVDECAEPLVWESLLSEQNIPPLPLWQGIEEAQWVRGKSRV